MFELYNLASIIQSDRPEVEAIEEHIALLNDGVSKNFTEGFMSKRTHDTGDDGPPSKRIRTIMRGQGGGTGMQLGEHDVYDDCEVVNAFTRAGYTLKSNNEDEDGFAELDQVKQTKCTV